MSMGWASARKLTTAVNGLRQVLAIELISAGRALDLRGPLRPAPGTAAALSALRTAVEGPGSDRIVADEIRAADELIASGAILAAVVDAIGDLQ